MTAYRRSGRNPRRTRTAQAIHDANRTGPEAPDQNLQDDANAGAAPAGGIVPGGGPPERPLRPGPPSFQGPRKAHP